MPRLVARTRSLDARLLGGTVAAVLGATLAVGPPASATPTPTPQTPTQWRWGPWWQERAPASWEMGWLVRMPHRAADAAPRASFVSPSAAAAARQSDRAAKRKAASARRARVEAERREQPSREIPLRPAPAGVAESVAAPVPAPGAAPSAAPTVRPPTPTPTPTPEAAPRVSAETPRTLELADAAVPKDRDWSLGTDELAGHLVAGAVGGANRLRVAVEVETAGRYELWVQRTPRGLSADLFTDERPPVLIGEDLGESLAGEGPGWRRIGEVQLRRGGNAIVVVARDPGYAIRAIRLGERRSHGPENGGERIAYD